MFHFNKIREKDIKRTIQEQSLPVKRDIFKISFIFTLQGCSQKVRFNKCSICFKSVLSLLVDILLVYLATIPWVKMETLSEMSLKKEATALCMIMSNLAFRIWYHKHGKTLISLSRKVQKLRIFIDNERKNSSKNNITLIFILSSLLSLSTVPFNTMATVENDEYEKRKLLSYFYLPQDNLIISYVFIGCLDLYIVWFIIALPFVFTIYFYFISSEMREVLRTFTEVCRKDEAFFEKEIVLKYDALSKTFKKTSKLIQQPLFIICIQILMCLFSGLYITLFSAEVLEGFVPQIALCLLGNSVNFILICYFSASVSKRYYVMKRTVHRILLEDNTPVMLILASMINKESPIRFTVLDSIVVDKNLALCTFGTLLTYGIMIATLGRTATM